MTSTDVRTRGPAARREQILDAAADQFRDHGYHNVGIDDIAQQVGLTGPALYRHFRGKQAVLDATIASVVEELVAVYGHERPELEATLAGIAEISVRRRAATTLWLREASHLPDERRRALRGRFRSSLGPLRTQVARLRPGLAADDVDLLVWACQAVFASPGYAPRRIDTDGQQRALTASALAVCERAVLGTRGGVLLPTERTPGRSPASRREAVLHAATRLLAERGFARVSMGDIGAEAGIAGPSLYHHFPSKSAILTAQLTRCVEVMAADLAWPLATAASSGRALAMMLGSLVRRNLHDWRTFVLLLDEVINLPADERRRLERAQEEYVREWVTLLRQHRTDLTEADADVRVRAALATVALLSRRRHFRARPGFEDELVSIGCAALGLEPR